MKTKKPFVLKTTETPVFTEIFWLTFDVMCNWRSIFDVLEKRLLLATEKIYKIEMAALHKIVKFSIALLSKHWINALKCNVEKIGKFMKTNN